MFSQFCQFDVEMELKKEKEKKKSKIQVKSISPIGAQTDMQVWCVIIWLVICHSHFIFVCQSNPIPRPNANVNGKSEKVPSQVALPQPQKAESSSGTTDLLGLDLISSANDEPFGFFTSADSGKPDEASATQPKEAKTLEDEEKDFFSQKAPEKSVETKLTNKSILSLYNSQAPTAAPLNGFMGQPVNALNQFPTGNPASFGVMNASKPVRCTFIFPPL